MTIEQGSVALLTSISIGLVMLLYFLYRRLFLERFRDRLFSLRESWFNLALDPNSSLLFDSSLYRSVEHSLCGMLRFAHRVSFVFIVVEKVSERVQGVQMDVGPVEEITRRVKKIPDEYTRTKALCIWDDIPRTILVYLLFTSVAFFLWTIGLVVYLIVRHTPRISGQGVQRVKKHVVKTNEPVLEKIESSAYREVLV